MITSDIFIRCIITRTPMAKKHKEQNFQADREWRIENVEPHPNLGPAVCGVLGWAPEVWDLSRNKL